jgi:predicted house-cleaning noncanonical NTP pyrophosphatase (MazG superfamily)
MKQYRTFLYNKLCRSKTVERLSNMGSKITWKLLDDVDFDKELRKKLAEETQEAIDTNSKMELIHELADVLEVMKALAVFHGISFDEIIKKQAKIKEERGGFQEPIFIEKATHVVGGLGEQYCLKDPARYPEIFE